MINYYYYDIIKKKKKNVTYRRRTRVRPVDDRRPQMIRTCAVTRARVTRRRAACHQGYVPNVAAAAARYETRETAVARRFGSASASRLALLSGYARYTQSLLEVSCPSLSRESENVRSRAAPIAP